MGVHPNARRRVHLENHRVVLAERYGDVFGKHVDAGDVETDDRGGHLASGDVVRMDLVGPVDRRAAGGQIRGAAKENCLILRRHEVEREPELGGETPPSARRRVDA
jgi:hypothetical protein